MRLTNKSRPLEKRGKKKWKKQFKAGQTVTWNTEEFDGTVTMKAIITEVHEDYCIAKTMKDSINLYIDEDTEYQFN